MKNLVSSFQAVTAQAAHGMMKLSYITVMTTPRDRVIAVSIHKNSLESPVVFRELIGASSALDRARH